MRHLAVILYIKLNYSLFLFSVKDLVVSYADVDSLEIITEHIICMFILIFTCTLVNFVISTRDIPNISRNIVLKLTTTVRIVIYNLEALTQWMTIGCIRMEDQVWLLR